jgi:hypothetical protein
MNKILYFIEKHKFGIVVALILHLLVFLYLQMKTYDERVPFEAWSFQGKNIEAPDDIEIAPDQIESFDEAQLDPEFFKEITSHVTNMNDDREKSTNKNEFYSSYKGNAEQNVRDFEKSVIANLQGNHTSDEGSASNTDMNEGNPKEKQDNSTKSTNQAGSEKAYAGETMVSYELSKRFPLNNNDWHIRNPGYTCGNLNGKVVVRVRVGNSGDVVYAKAIPELSKNPTDCMIKQAEKYALKSRFNFDGSADKQQEGIITYQFVYRKP